MPQVIAAVAEGTTAATTTTAATAIEVGAEVAALAGEGLGKAIEFGLESQGLSIGEAGTSSQSISALEASGEVGQGEAIGSSLASAGQSIGIDAGETLIAPEAELIVPQADLVAPEADLIKKGLGERATDFALDQLKKSKLGKGFEEAKGFVNDLKEGNFEKAGDTALRQLTSGDNEPVDISQPALQTDFGGEGQGNERRQQPINQAKAPDALKAIGEEFINRSSRGLGLSAERTTSLLSGLTEEQQEAFLKRGIQNNIGGF